MHDGGASKVVVIRSPLVLRNLLSLPVQVGPRLTGAEAYRVTGLTGLRSTSCKHEAGTRASDALRGGLRLCGDE